MRRSLRRTIWTTRGIAALGAILMLVWTASVQAADPIKIGFSTSLTGGLASSGKANLLAQQIWQEQVNAEGGLLGRPVELVYYDDQSNAGTVPAIYAKLLDVDKVDLLQPKTVAIVGADADFSNNAMTGARANAKKYGLDIVYDRTYPPATVDYSPIVRAIQATNPDLVFVASYPLDSVGMVQAATELGLKAQMFGGAMVGLQYAVFMQKLGPKLERIVNFHLYVPAPTMNFPGIEQFLKTYQARAPQQGTDPLGFYQPPFAYAAMQVLEQAVKATGTLDDGKLADYIHKSEFNTIVGKLRFDEKGEWAKPRLLMVQFQNVEGGGLDQFKNGGKEVILYPPEYKDGDLRQPFAK